MAQQGEGSRGGKIIRHTKGGYPVYESDRTKTIKAHASGAAAVAGGVAIAHGTGKIAARATHQHALLENHVQSLAKAGGQASKMAVQHAADFARVPGAIRAAGVAAGAAAIGYGVNKILKEHPAVGAKTRAGVVTGAAGAGAGFALRNSLYRSLGGSRKSAALHAIVNVAKEIKKK